MSQIATPFKLLITGTKGACNCTFHILIIIMTFHFQQSSYFKCSSKLIIGLVNYYECYTTHAVMDHVTQIMSRIYSINSIRDYKDVYMYVHQAFIHFFCSCTSKYYYCTIVLLTV